MRRFHREEFMVDTPITIEMSGPADGIADVMNYSLNEIMMTRCVRKSDFVSAKKYGIDVLELKDEADRSNRISMMEKMRDALHKKEPANIKVEVKDRVQEVVLESWLLKAAATGSGKMTRSATLKIANEHSNVLKMIKETSDKIDALELNNVLLGNFNRVFPRSRAPPVD